MNEVYEEEPDMGYEEAPSAASRHDLPPAPHEVEFEHGDGDLGFEDEPHDALSGGFEFDDSPAPEARLPEPPPAPPVAAPEPPRKVRIEDFLPAEPEPLPQAPPSGPVLPRRPLAATIAAIARSRSSFDRDFMRSRLLP